MPTHPGAERAERPFRRVVEPGAHETIFSWQARIAGDLHVPLTAVWRGGGIREWQVTGDGESVLLVRLSAGDAARFANATGRTVEQIRAMELSALHGGPLDLSTFDASDAKSVRRLAASQPVTLRTWRVCPKCLSETGGAVRMHDHLSGTAVCPTHGDVLLEACPSCGQPIGLGRGGRLHPAQPGTYLDPCRCRCLVRIPEADESKRTRMLCAFRLDQISDPGSELPEANIAAAVRWDGWVSRWLDNDWPSRFGPPRILFNAYRAFGSLCAYGFDGIHFTSPDSLIDRFVVWAGFCRDQGKVSTWTAEPRDVGVAAIVQPEIMATLADDGTVDHDRVIELAARVCERRRRMHNAAGVEDHGFGMPPELLPIWRDACRRVQPGSAAIARRVPAPDAGWELTVEYIPALIPSHAFEVFAALLVGMADDTARMYVSLCLAKLVTPGRSWARLGVLLGMPTGKADRVAGFASRKIRAAGTLDDFWEEVEVLAARLDRAAEKGDAHLYGIARRTFTEPELIDTDEWFAVAVAAGVHPGRTTARMRNANAWLWAHLTGSHPHWAPGLQDEPGVTVESLREDYRRFCHDAMTPALERELKAAAHRLMLERT